MISDGNRRTWNRACVVLNKGKGHLVDGLLKTILNDLKLLDPRDGQLGLETLNLRWNSSRPLVKSLLMNG